MSSGVQQERINSSKPGEPHRRQDKGAFWKINAITAWGRSPYCPASAGGREGSVLTAAYQTDQSDVTNGQNGWMAS